MMMLSSQQRQKRIRDSAQWIQTTDKKTATNNNNNNNRRKKKKCPSEEAALNEKDDNNFLRHEAFQKCVSMTQSIYFECLDELITTTTQGSSSILEFTRSLDKKLLPVVWCDCSFSSLDRSALADYFLQTLGRGPNVVKNIKVVTEESNNNNNNNNNNDKVAVCHIGRRDYITLAEILCDIVSQLYSLEETSLNNNNNSTNHHTTTRKSKNQLVDNDDLTYLEVDNKNDNIAQTSQSTHKCIHNLLKWARATESYSRLIVILEDGIQSIALNDILFLFIELREQWGLPISVMFLQSSVESSPCHNVASFATGTTVNQITISRFVCPSSESVFVQFVNKMFVSMELPVAISVRTFEHLCELFKRSKSVVYVIKSLNVFFTKFWAKEYSALASILSPSFFEEYSPVILKTLASIGTRPSFINELYDSLKLEADQRVDVILMEQMFNWINQFLHSKQYTSIAWIILSNFLLADNDSMEKRNITEISRLLRMYNSNNFSKIGENLDKMKERGDSSNILAILCRCKHSINNQIKIGCVQGSVISKDLQILNQSLDEFVLLFSQINKKQEEETTYDKFDNAEEILIHELSLFFNDIFVKGCSHAAFIESFQLKQYVMLDESSFSTTHSLSIDVQHRRSIARALQQPHPSIQHHDTIEAFQANSSKSVELKEWFDNFNCNISQRSATDSKSSAWERFSFALYELQFCGTILSQAETRNNRLKSVVEKKTMVWTTGLD